MSFTVRTHRVRVGEAHDLAVPEPYRHEIWFFEPTDAAVVLGSTQSSSTLDLGEVSRRGLDVVRRRSGGGAVVVEPGTLTWFDLVLPVSDSRYERDVGRSAWWLGRRVAATLRSLGVDADAPTTTGDTTKWSSLACFAGVGAGEVRVAGRKAVGISQWRTRFGARYQVMIPHRFHGADQAALFALAPEERAELAAHLADTVTVVTVEPDRLRAALVETLIAD